jgi:hypothetical protein
MTATWITVGTILIGGMLIIAAILPRTKAEYSLAQLPVAFTSAVRQASRFAVGSEGTRDQNPDAATTDAEENQQSDRGGSAQGEGQKGEAGKSKSKAKAEGPGKASDSAGGQSKGDSADQSDQANDQDSKGNSDSEQSQGDQGKAAKDDKSKGKKGSLANGKSEAAGQEKSDDAQQGEQPSENSSDPSAAASSQNESQPAPQQPPYESSRPFFNWNPLGMLFTAFQWLFWLALLIAGLVAGWYYREQLAAAWQKLLKELRELWARWFGEKTVAAEQAEAVALPAPPRPFPSFSDPFAGGEAARMPWPELVRYTFAAVEAWGRERDCPRQADQTPHEFAHNLASLEPQIAAPVQSLASWYAQLAYAPRAAAGKLDPLRQLWREMRATHPTAALR